MILNQQKRDLIGDLVFDYENNLTLKFVLFDPTNRVYSLEEYPSWVEAENQRKRVGYPFTKIVRVIEG